MISTVESPHTAARPTRVRFAVVGFAVVLGMVTYLDRACIGTLEDPIMRDLGLSQHQLSYVHSAFALAYGAFGIFSAWWGDRIGTRIMLTAIVLAWSAFTMATGAAQGLISLIAIQFCFGASESGAWPAVTRTLSRWIPYRERGRAQGIAWVGAHITAGLTPLLVNELSYFMSWRAIFSVFGLIGLLWAAAWYWWFRDEPSQHAQVNEAELAYILADRQPAVAEGRSRESAAGPAFWWRLVTHRNVWALCLMYLPNSFIVYFCITWFHKYLSEGRCMAGRELAFFAGLPLLLSVVGDVLGGSMTDWAVRRFGRRWGRAGVGVAAYVVAGGSLLLATLAREPWLGATLFAVGTAANMFQMGTAWGTCQDVGGGHAGVVSATMNTAGQVGAMICPPLVVYLKDYSSYGWNADLALMGGSFLLASLFWFVIDPRKKVFPE
jgi:sugar phosphate permease